MAGDDATIDPVMVPEPALPVEPSSGAAPPLVRRATAADVDAMAAQLAKTFWDDPVTSHIFRGERRRDAGLRAFFGTQMRADYLPFGGCYTTDGYTGSAIWAPAGKPLLTGLTAILTMVPVLPYVWNRLPTTLRLLNLLESKHPHEPHWYLATLGTAVELQGKGVGSALMQPVLDALRRGRAALLPGVVEGAQRALLPAPRLRGRAGGAAARRRAVGLDHVEEAPAGGVSGPAGPGWLCRGGHPCDGNSVSPNGCGTWPRVGREVYTSRRSVVPAWVTTREFLRDSSANLV